VGGSKGADVESPRTPRAPALLPQALTTLKEVHKVTGHSLWLMPNRLEVKPASQNTMIFAVYRMGFHKRTTVLLAAITSGSVPESRLLYCENPGWL